MTSSSADAMLATAVDFDETRESLVSTMSNMDTQLEPLRAGWRGQASVTFDNALQRWSGEFQKILQHLTAMSEMLHQGAGQYGSTEADAVQQSNIY